MNYGFFCRLTMVNEIVKMNDTDLAKPFYQMETLMWELIKTDLGMGMGSIDSKMVQSTRVVINMV